MNKQDGHEMLVERCKVLEKIALHYITLHTYETATHFPTAEEHKANLEREIERRLNEAH